MSTELYEVLSLASRYLFALLGVLIVLRAFTWLLSDRAEKHRRLRQLPNAGMIGEFVVISGSRELPEGSSVPVPWEGELGSFRSADVFIPCEGVARKQLFFSFEPGRGLLLRPFSGREALVNNVPVHFHSNAEDLTMTHGSFLQVGQAMLRLRLFAGLDPSAGFDTGSGDPQPVVQGQMPPVQMQQPVLQAQQPLPLMQPMIPQDQLPFSPEPSFPVSPAQSMSAGFPVDAPERIYTVQAAQEPVASIDPGDFSLQSDFSSNELSSGHSRRSSRWEVKQETEFEYDPSNQSSSESPRSPRRRSLSREVDWSE